MDSQTNLDQIYSEIVDELRLQYEIGYEPPDSQPGKHHKIELKAKDKSLTVLQSRQGYNSPSSSGEEKLQQGRKTCKPS